jgi:predicted transcriptional regulator
MNIIYESGRATAAEVRDAMASPPSYSAVRATLRVLLEKGHLSHKQDGPRYVYLPTVTRDQARRSALQQLLRTFFDGSTNNAVAALLDMESSKLSPDELERLAQMIDKAKSEGR